MSQASDYPPSKNLAVLSTAILSINAVQCGRVFTPLNIYPGIYFSIPTPHHSVSEGDALELTRWAGNGCGRCPCETGGSAQLRDRWLLK